MANNIAFQEMGITVRINVATSANGATAGEVFIRCGTTSTSNVAIPLAGTPNYGTILHNNQTVIFTAPRLPTVEGGYIFYVSAIVATGTATVYVTPGEGL